MDFKTFFFLFYLVLVFESVMGQRRFEKEHGMATIFPPSIVKPAFEEMPIGHLRSLGHQRAPDGPVMETRKTPNPVEFLRDFVVKNEPLVVRTTVDRESPIMSSWTDDKLRASHSDTEVHTIPQQETVDGKTKKMRLDRFLQEYKETDIYMATTVPFEMSGEITMPTFLQCGPISRSLIEVELWMAHGGAGSLLHYHGDHQVHCVVDGRKDFILYEAKYQKDLKCIEKHPYLGEGYSQIATEIVNVFENPELSKTPWTYSTLLTGDCIFIPAGFVHQVRSYGRSLSYTIQFAPRPDSDSTDCRKFKLTTRPLSAFQFLWTSKQGIEQTFNEQLTSQDLKHILHILMRNDSVLRFERFQHFYETAVQKSQRKMPEARVVFNNLDPQGKGKLSVTQVEDLKPDRLEKVIRILNSVHHELHDEL